MITSMLRHLRRPWLPVAAIGAVAVVSALAWLLARPAGRSSEPHGPPAAPALDVRSLERQAQSASDPDQLLRFGERLRRAGATQAASEATARAYEARSRDPRF